jgi:hypothetical protein
VSCNQINVSDNVWEGLLENKRGIVMNDSAYWVVIGNVFGPNSASGTTAIRIIGGSDGRITGNVVAGSIAIAIEFFSSVATRVDINGNNLSATTAINISNASSEITISDNLIENSTTGILIGATAIDVRVVNNHFVSVTTPVSDLAASIIRGNSFQEPTVTTNDTTPTTLFSFALRDNSVYIFKAFVAARDIAGAERAAYERTVRAHREGGGAVVGSVQDDFTDETVNMDTTWTTSGNNIILQVTGFGTLDIDWVGQVEWRSTGGFSPA